MSVLDHPQEILIGTLLFVILIFEVVMFVHMLTNKKLSTAAKVWWAVGMFLLHPFVAIYYLYAEMYRRKA